jgi:pimeloyl-ACP methyl ester carboxylesterase
MLSPKDVTTRAARIRFVEAGDGPAVLLVHDALGSHEGWSRAAPHLAKHFRIVAPDLPGFGESEKPDPQRYAYGYDAFAESVFDVVAALGLGRVDVIGHGMGAGVALTLAALHPSVVRKLVLVSPPVQGGDIPLARAARVPVVGGLLWKQLVGRALFGSVLGGSTYAGAAGVPEGRVDALYRYFSTPAARQAAHATLVAIGDTRPLGARMPRVTAETFVVWGRDDALTPVDQGRRLARELKGRFEVLECGRCPPDEVPEVFATAAVAFLEGPPPSRLTPGSSRRTPPPPSVAPRTTRSTRSTRDQPPRSTRPSSGDV